jgi:RecA/RadA recombinase
MAEGFNKSDDWVSCGNFAMNRQLSGHFGRGFPYNKTVIIGGESGSGKSLIAATAAAIAQKADNALVIWLDAEKASKEEWLWRVGIDGEDDELFYAEVGTIGDVKKFVADLVKDLKSDSEPQKVFLVIDSYSVLMTEKQMEEAVKGEVKGDQGQQAKQLKDLIKSITHLIPRVPVCVVGMVHSMASQNMYEPDEIQTGGRGLIYLASLSLNFSKYKMKAELVEDNVLKDEYDDGKKIVGIRCKASVYKSRFAKPNEKVDIQIPWPKGIDPFSGLFDYMLENGHIQNPSKGWYLFINDAGEEVKFQKKGFRDYAVEIMNNILREEGKEPLDEDLSRYIAKGRHEEESPFEDVVEADVDE